MLINNIDISTFNAKQLKADIQTSTLSNNSEWIKGSLTPFFDENNVGFKTIKLELCFKGESQDSILDSISNFMSNCLGVVTLKLDNYDKNYKCILTENETSSTVSSEAFIKTLTFVGFKFGNEISEIMNLSLSKTIIVSGNLKTQAIVEITPTVTLSDIVLYGFVGDPITINNLTANKKVILDAEQGLVTVDGVNKYLDTDFWDFPILKPGAQTITCSRNTANITIRYKPKYV